MNLIVSGFDREPLEPTFKAPPQRRRAHRRQVLDLERERGEGAKPRGARERLGELITTSSRADAEAEELARVE